MDKDKYLLIISLPFLKSVKSGVILRILQENQELYSVFSYKIGSCGKDINNVLEMEKIYNNSAKNILPPSFTPPCTTDVETRSNSYSAEIIKNFIICVDFLVYLGLKLIVY